MAFIKGGRPCDGQISHLAAAFLRLFRQTGRGKGRESYLVGSGQWQ